MEVNLKLQVNITHEKSKSEIHSTTGTGTNHCVWLQGFPFYAFSVSMFPLALSRLAPWTLVAGGVAGLDGRQRSVVPASHAGPRRLKRSRPYRSSQADGFLGIMTRWHLQNEQAIGLTDSPWPARGMPSCPIILLLFFPGFTQKLVGEEEFLNGKKRWERSPE